MGNCSCGVEDCWDDESLVSVVDLDSVDDESDDESVNADDESVDADDEGREEGVAVVSCVVCIVLGKNDSEVEELLLAVAVPLP